MECLSLGSKWKTKKKRESLDHKFLFKSNPPAQDSPAFFHIWEKHAWTWHRWSHSIQSTSVVFVAYGTNYHRNTEEEAEAVSVWCDTDNLWPFSLKKKNYLHMCISRYKIIIYFPQRKDKTAGKLQTLSWFISLLFWFKRQPWTFPPTLLVSDVSAETGLCAACNFTVAGWTAAEDKHVRHSTLETALWLPGSRDWKKDTIYFLM